LANGRMQGQTGLGEQASRLARGPDPRPIPKTLMATIDIGD
jgi:hypothetical protein